MADEVNPFNLPFDEAIAYFLHKVNVPSEYWSQIWQEMHARAFTVAGAMQEDLLNDLRTAVEKGLTEGISLGDFKNEFNDIVARYGWQFKGEKNWRAGIIFNTNMRVAYSAGRYRQMVDPEVLAARPYWMYDAVNDDRTRPQHRAWDNLVLPADDPWWDTHYPPNGWNCRCMIRNLGQRDLDRMGLKVQSAPDQGTYEWTDPKTGEVHDVPVGIDPGWAYNPGQAGLANVLG